MDKNKISKYDQARFSLILAMVIFGTIGVFRKYIPISSTLIALIRGVIGSAFLYLVVKLSRKQISFSSFKENWLYLILSGGFIGFNWILLFEAYNYTSVAVATLCYYMAPVIVLLLSPIILKERLTVRKSVCILCAIIGMFFISGVFSVGGIPNVRGVLLGLGAATLYAFVVLLNKKIKIISYFDKTIFQLSVASLVLLPYALFTVDFEVISFDIRSIILLMFVGIVHTGISYYLYFGSMSELPAQTVALYSYIDPIVAILLSAVLLREGFGFQEVIGTVLILGSTVICETPKNMFKKCFLLNKKH